MFRNFVLATALGLIAFGWAGDSAAEIVQFECFNENLRQTGAYDRTQGLVGQPGRLEFDTDQGTVRVEGYDRCVVLDWGDPFVMFSCIELAENPLDNRISAALFDRRTSRYVTETATKHHLTPRPNSGRTGSIEYFYDYDDCTRRHF